MKLLKLSHCGTVYLILFSTKYQNPPNPPGRKRRLEKVLGNLNKLYLRSPETLTPTLLVHPSHLKSVSEIIGNTENGIFDTEGASPFLLIMCHKLVT